MYFAYGVGIINFYLKRIFFNVIRFWSFRFLDLFKEQHSWWDKNCLCLFLDFSSSFLQVYYFQHYWFVFLKRVCSCRTLFHLCVSSYSNVEKVPRCLVIFSVCWNLWLRHIFKVDITFPTMEFLWCMARNRIKP